MAYVPNPADPTQPTSAVDSGSMYLEFQALKGYIQSLIATGTNWSYFGSFRNRLHNGAFLVNQRGASITVPTGTVTTYTSDRWFCLSTGSTCTALPSTNAGAGVYSNSSWINLQPASGNTQLIFGQRIESYDAKDLISGTSITVSGYYYVTALGAGVPNISLYTPATTRDIYTSANACSTSVAMNITNPVTGLAAATWCYFSNTLVLTQDATLGLELLFTFPSGIPSQSINFAYLQLEKGTQATPFEFRPLQTEIDFCQRYFLSQQMVIENYGLASTVIQASIPLGTNMRTTTPTVVISAAYNSNISSYTLTAGGVGILLAQGTVTSSGMASLNLVFTASSDL